LTDPRTIIFRTTAVWLSLLAALALAACGGSSSKTTGTAASTKPQATTPGATATTQTGAKHAESAAAVAYRKCLEAHGAGLPRLVPGPGGSIALGHLKPPKGVSQGTYNAAVKACGGSVGGTTAVTKAITRFIACMRANGVNVPAPGKGKGLLSYLGDVKNPKFSPALKKCAALLRETPGSSQ
jgi:hypothetical protein